MDLVETILFKADMNTLEKAVQCYTRSQANQDGLAHTPVAGLRMMCLADAPRDMHSVYRPLVCFVLKGAKRMIIGSEEVVVSGGQSIIVGADIPVTGRIIKASKDVPYMAVAVELEMTLLYELASQIGESNFEVQPDVQPLFTQDSEQILLDCVTRLVELLDRPQAIHILRYGIMKELHFWLLSGRHGQALRSLADPNSYANRLSVAIRILRADYRSRVSTRDLAASASMGLTSFHNHFKKLTSLTPGQYQKRLRLIEARRLIFEDGYTAGNAAYEVGYESVSQFTREYSRLFKTPPKQDFLRKTKK